MRDTFEVAQEEVEMIVCRLLYGEYVHSIERRMVHLSLAHLGLSGVFDSMRRDLTHLAPTG